MVENSTVHLLGASKGAAMVNPHNDYYCSLWQLIELDADKLTICPWMCAKYRIPVFQNEDALDGRQILVRLMEFLEWENPFSISLDFEAIKEWDGVTVFEL